MADVRVRGGRRLEGEVEVRGAKNSALPIMAASLLCDGEVLLTRVPKLSDVAAGALILRYLGAEVEEGRDTLRILPAKNLQSGISKELMNTMRSSLFYLAPLLVRTGKAEIFQPGGCNLGPRPIDMHIDGLCHMGAQSAYCDGCYSLSAPGGLCGADITLRTQSVGATETLLMAAVLAHGSTVLRNAACEPEVVDLAAFLNRCGAKIQNAGEKTVFITGVPALAGCTHALTGDRILASTLLCAVAAASGEIVLKGAPYAHYSALCGILARGGVEIQVCGPQQVAARAKGGLRGGRFSVRTAPYPGFATDSGPLLAAAFLKGSAELELYETVFETRFACAAGFLKMGACLSGEGRKLSVSGTQSLRGAAVAGTDLRGGAALVVAALAAEGESLISGRSFIDRGYENIVNLFAGLGAEIEEV